MSRENVELLRRVAEAFNAGGLDGVLPLCDPEVVWHEDPSFPEAGVYRGREEWAAYARQFLAEFSELRYEVGETVEAGDHVVANMRIRGRGDSSRAQFDISAWWAVTVQDGKIVRCYSYLDRERALAAVGLSD